MSIKYIASVTAAITIVGFAALAGSANAQTMQGFDGTANLTDTATGTGTTMDASGVMNSAPTSSSSDSTGSSMTSTSTTTVPGVPNTGAGGDAALNMLVLFASGTLAIGGAAYITRRTVRR